MLEWWHTLWTDLSHLFAAHWGDELGDDPSLLGHSAAKLGRKKPTNLGKVDYYPNTQLAHLILDVCLLDCWRIWQDGKPAEDQEDQESMDVDEELNEDEEGVESDYDNTSDKHSALFAFAQVVDGELQLIPMDMDDKAMKAMELAEEQRAMGQEEEEGIEEDIVMSNCSDVEE
ncbi:hypothetical protein C0991_003758 [Blastosporella zonata]|nr:hypothetical protein C0991_003758 [Blastosporella zonata]